jgi:sigma-B regulation protein RsbU (phosphoserine phosphatase)
MFLVLEGNVVITLHGAEIDRLGPGDLMGEMALAEDRPRSARATAETNCKLLRIGHEEFSQLVQASPDFALQVMSAMSGRLRRFIDEEVRRQRLEEELRIGREIQLSLIPDACPNLGGWEFAATYQPARQVGGDFYDFIFAENNHDEMQMVIADVTGKGVPAALFMASCRTTIRAESVRGEGPGETLSRANCVIALDTRYPLFITAFCARLHAGSGSVTFANGGHERPFWLKASSGSCQVLESHDPLLGFAKDVQYEEYSITVEIGDFLVFFTDGVTEARNAQGHFYGDERLQRTIEARAWASAQALLEGILASVEEFSGDSPAADDLTLVVARRLAV